MVLDQMTKWSGHATWTSGQATRGLWITTPTHDEDEDDHSKQQQSEEFAGWVKVHQHLTFLVVYNSGHLVPFNLPGPSLDLLARFLSNTSFVDKVIPNHFENASRRPPPVTMADSEAFDEREQQQDVRQDYNRDWWRSVLLGAVVGGLVVGVVHRQYL